MNNGSSQWHKMGDQGGGRQKIGLYINTRALLSWKYIFGQFSHPANRHFESMTGTILIESCYCYLFNKTSWWLGFENHAVWKLLFKPTSKPEVLICHILGMFSMRTNSPVYILLATRWKGTCIYFKWIRHRLNIPKAESIFPAFSASVLSSVLNGTQRPAKKYCSIKVNLSSRSTNDLSSLQLIRNVFSSWNSW